MLAWDKSVDLMRQDLSDREFNTWIAPLEIGLFGDGIVNIVAPNRYVAEWFEREYAAKMQEHMIQDMGQISLVVGIQEHDQHGSHAVRQQGYQKGRGMGNKKKDAKTGLLPQYIFKNFVVGDSNNIAYAAAESISSENSHYKQLLLYGSTGIGKSHLMHSIGNQLISQYPDIRLHYTTSNNFVNQMIRAIRYKSMPDFNNFYSDLDVLLIDDIQFLAGKKSSESAFFDAFEALNKKGGVMVFTSDRYPRDIANLSDRVINRLEHSLTLGIEPPNAETRVAILMQKCKEMECENMLKEEVLFFIAECVRSDVRALEGLLQSVLAVANFSGVSIQDITVDFIKRTQKDKINVHKQSLTSERIIKGVADYYHIQVSDIMSSRRQRAIAHPRQLAMYIAKRHTRQSLSYIGKSMGNRDHTTVLHAARQVEIRLEEGPTKDAYEHLKIRLGIYE